MMPLGEGRSLGPYRIVGELGRGAAAGSRGRFYVFGGIVEQEKRALDSVEELTP